MDPNAMPLKGHPDIQMQRYKLAVGYNDGVKPGNIVGAIANEANIESKFIGHIEIFDGFATVDLPDNMPKETVDHLKKTRVCGRPLSLEIASKAASGGDSNKRGPGPRDSKPRDAKPRGDRKPRKAPRKDAE